jgi:type II secretory pathway pseudopilin PulG
MNKKKELGFTVVEVLLTLILIALIVLIGLYVYSNHKTTNKTSTTNPTTSTTKTSSSSTTISNQDVIKISELGIEITVPNSIKDLTYQLQPTVTLANGVTATYAYFSTMSLTRADSGCSDSNGPLGSLERAAGQYPGGDVVDYGTLVKQFSDFYISSATPQAACSSSDTVQSLAQTQKQAFVTAESTISQL